MEINRPSDYETRVRFATETEKNFSLICPAGSGKTHSVVQRILALASRPDASRVLRELVLVTFTKKAAEEMQVRARDALEEMGVSGEVRGAFNQSFFGTIHAFAVLLLQTYGHHIGIPSSFEMSENDDLTWARFLRDWTGKEELWSNPRSQRIVRSIPLHDILKLARKWDFARTAATPLNEPAFNFDAVYTFPAPSRRDTAANIARFQQDLQKWEKAWSSGEADVFQPMPSPAKGGKDFIATAINTITPVRKWLNAEGTWLAREIALAYQKFRIGAGVLTFADQLSLAAQLVRCPEAVREIRKRNFRVILDEAQDTDPEQFELLLEIARPMDSAGSWTEGTSHPAGGRFTMVGDLQQSIYRDRADLTVYRRAHEYLIAGPAGEALSYEVTFRCDRAVIDQANTWFPQILDSRDGQVGFVKLAHRPNAGEGQVIRINVSETQENQEFMQARDLAQFLRSSGLAKLRARTWGEVAILCPRKRWFSALRTALNEVGLRCQLLSSRETLADSPAFAWSTAISVIMADPFNSFEIVGVLREVFGVSDHDIAFYSRSQGDRFQIARPALGECPVAKALNALCEVRSKAIALSPGEAARVLDFELLENRVAALCDDKEAAVKHRHMAIALAAETGATGGTLVDWSKRMVESLSNAPEEDARDPNAVSIVTNLKSKGLEWDVVVVPYLFREISERSEEYPRLVGKRSEPAVAVYAKADINERLVESDDIADRQELARIAYVTLTRARHTLVLVDDRATFGARGISPYSIGGALRFDESNKTSFEALSEVACADGASEFKATATPMVKAVEYVDIVSARTAAEDFREQVTPHRLAKSYTKDEPEVRAFLLRDDAGASVDRRAYGIWWHNMMRDLPWSEGKQAWQSFFEGVVVGCSEPDRAAKEWGLFLSSPLASELSSPGVIVQTEVPFHAPLRDGRILEGVIDLLAVFPDRPEIKLVDWKATHTENPDTAREIYSDQLKAYTQAASAITGSPVIPFLFLTNFGEVAA